MRAKEYGLIKKLQDLAIEVREMCAVKRRVIIGTIVLNGEDRVSPNLTLQIPRF